MSNLSVGIGFILGAVAAYVLLPFLGLPKEVAGVAALINVCIGFVFLVPEIVSAKKGLEELKNSRKH